ncbi:unnamed protein product, partial [Dibothriocephalus latus]
MVVASARAEEVLLQVTKQANAAQTVKAQVQTVKDRAQVLVDAIGREKANAEEKLEAAKPALQEAEAALETIKPSHIATVRKLGRPPHLIMRIMDCVAILFKRPLDPDTINAETVELMEPYFNMEDFNFTQAKRTCGDVAGLCSWTKAMASFFAVNKEVLPLK